MNRLKPIKFADNRSAVESEIPLEFLPISNSLKEAYAEFYRLVWDYMGTTGNPPIRELNKLLSLWLNTSANLTGNTFDQRDLERILDLISFLSELQSKTNELNWFEKANQNALDYVNSQADKKEVSHDQ